MFYHLTPLSQMRSIRNWVISNNIALDRRAYVQVISKPAKI